MIDLSSQTVTSVDLAVFTQLFNSGKKKNLVRSAD